MSSQLGDSPVYPIVASTGDPRDGVYCRDGVTLRQWYAGKALEGAIAYYGQSDDPEERSEMASLCLKHVDALLNELEKEVKP